MWLLPLPDQIEVLLYAAFIVPIIGAAIGKEGARVGGCVASSVAFAASFYITFAQFSVGLTASISVAQPPDTSIIVLDRFSNFVSLVVLGISLLATIYAVSYVRERHTEFYTLVLLLAMGMLGVFYAGDVIAFFVFWEVMSVASYLLVAFNYREWEAVEASLKYLIMSSTGSAALLFGISLLYGLTGELTFTGLRSALTSGPIVSETWTIISVALVLAGLGVNVALAPFHFWLPDAHPAAPSPVSALLSGVVIKTGVYAMLRLLLNIFPTEAYGWQLGVLLLSLVTMSVGNLMAALQEDIKRLLAFSSIANIGYIAFGMSIGNELGAVGALLHLLNHAVAKALLFLAAGSFIHTFHTRNLDELAGAGKLMPLSGVTYTVGALSLAGMPGLNAFVSEYVIIAAAFQSPFWPFAIVMIVNVLIGAMYHMRVVQTLFLKSPSNGRTAVREAAFPMLLALIALTAAAIIIGILPAPFLGAAQEAIQFVRLRG
ncbi:MAG: hypothetical protein NZ957_03815 [Thaumarchaeota archaeon]|nr:hypothetical protein [Candidatus Calditenuaceae archaeon]MDW8041785.1 proton-conducting transporter membrane subunit [Nitrososphaerota archaeon]